MGADSHGHFCAIGKLLFDERKEKIMNIIETKNLNKTYRRLMKPEGLRGCIKSLWKRTYEEKAAVSNLDFTMEEGEFVGLDAIASRQIRKFLAEVNKERGNSIILTSHYMEDIKTLCGRSVVINHGKKLYDGDTAGLFEKYQKNKRISISFTEACKEVRLPDYAKVVEQTPYKQVVETAKDAAGEILERIMPFHPSDITVEEDEIGTVVERIYKESDIDEKI